MAARALVHIYTLLFPHAQLKRYFYQAFMQRQFHFLKYIINACMPPPVGQVTIGSYFGKSGGQYVLFKAAYKLCGSKCHLLLFMLISIILIIKSYGLLFIIYTADSMIAYRYFVGISA